MPRELGAKGNLAAVTRMGLYINRYCFTLFAPMAIAMTIYGQALLAVWYRPEVCGARRSAAGYYGGGYDLGGLPPSSIRVRSCTAWESTMDSHGP